MPQLGILTVMCRRGKGGCPADGGRDDLGMSLTAMAANTYCAEAGSAIVGRKALLDTTCGRLRSNTAFF